jgi:cytochrome c oxidase assembly factor 2
MTSSLFATTVVASFFVVALPHVLPCPAPRVALADGEMPDGSQKRRRRRRVEPEVKDGMVRFPALSEDDVMGPSKTKRECPVPKPGGVVGELLGFKKSDAGEQQSRPAR